MYVNLEHVKVLIALLKEYGVRNIVLSPGTRNVAFVNSVAYDSDFKCYSIVDERSAAFFAIGLIQELEEPVAICCTSGTAVCNYLSAVSEAYYQCLPLVVLTADRNPYYLNQLEDQMIPQQEIFKGVCKKEVSIPMIYRKEDAWYCNRIINEALMELDHHGKGPIHINFSIPDGHFSYDSESLPVVNVINRYTANDKDKLKECFSKLYKCKKVLINYGQNNPLSEQETQKLNQFAQKYKAVISVDHLSNLHEERCVRPFMISKVMTADMQEILRPDIVISFNGNFVSGIKGLVSGRRGGLAHWLVKPDGTVADPFRNLDIIFEMPMQEFVDLAIQIPLEENDKEDEYLENWKKYEQMITYPEVEYCDWYVVKRFIEELPHNVLLHLANSSSVRLAQYFDLDPSIRVYCNRGTNGIDGSMSAYVAQSYVSKANSYLVIGDLSFFYDMNALWNRYVNNRMRILLNNNEGAQIFHYTHGKKRLPGINDFMAAEHFTSAKGWVEERGFRYMKVTDKESLEHALPIFMGESDEPILLEVITDKELDAEILKKIESANGKVDKQENIISEMKNGVKHMLKEKVKNIIYE